MSAINKIDVGCSRKKKPQIAFFEELRGRSRGRTSGIGFIRADSGNARLQGR